jgi:precorrin-4/cobalt-precorrin-4 C11-methyltransferase
VPEAESLASLARHGASLVIYLSMGRIDQVAQVLSRTYGPETPCAVACRVSHPEERILRTRVADLAETARTAAIDRLAVILIGPALEDPDALASLRSRLYDPEFAHGHRTV